MWLIGKETDVSRAISVLVMRGMMRNTEMLAQEYFSEFGNTVCYLVAGTPRSYSTDLSFDPRCVYCLTSRSIWFYTVSED